ncbi:MAG: lysophospholipid acyltransferase family protein [Proteobacteria bacterium]|nr:lysophospholipid acyltransferase family protein [Pseudomonadota bacterium]MBU1059154.1 lysophospholipid acyltransferase family protein [Pseudomonadota bacterium]
MKGILYRALVAVTTLCGPWFFIVISRAIAAGYFVFSKNVPESRRFYALLYPQKRSLFHLWCTFCQYQNFTTIHLDRFLASHGQQTQFRSEGWEKLESVVEKKGAILLMSHLGNWEIAAHLLKQQEGSLKLLLYMGVKDKEDVERLQKEYLHQSGVTIIGVEKEGGSPFEAVEGIRLLQDGGLVSMTGDIVWRSDQRKRRVRFLGQEAFVPEAPYVFALVSGAPIFVFFTFRTGENSYAFILSDPIVIKRGDKKERDTVIQAAAQQYADLLEEKLHEHPLEWYHFDRFVL